jgi:hypothetical protein
VVRTPLSGFKGAKRDNTAAVTSIEGAQGDVTVAVTSVSCGSDACAGRDHGFSFPPRRLYMFSDRIFG